MHDEGRDKVEALQAENELLTFENQALRAQLSADVSDHDDPRSIGPERMSELLRAERDLKWLLKRLGRGPTGFLIKRFRGYRRLVGRYPDQNGS